MLIRLREKIASIKINSADPACDREVKKIGKTLNIFGVLLMIIGFGGAFACFVLFSTAGLDAFDENGFSARILVPFILIIPLFLTGGLGIVLERLGSYALSNNIADTKLINDNDGIESNEQSERKYVSCKYCGSTCTTNSTSCPKCGANLPKK